MIFSVHASSRLLHLNGIDKSGDFEAFWLGLYQAVLEVLSCVVEIPTYVLQYKVRFSFGVCKGYFGCGLNGNRLQNNPARPRNLLLRNNKRWRYPHTLWCKQKPIS